MSILDKIQDTYERAIHSVDTSVSVLVLIPKGRAFLDFMLTLRDEAHYMVRLTELGGGYGRAYANLHDDEWHKITSMRLRDIKVEFLECDIPDIVYIPTFLTIRAYADARKSKRDIENESGKHPGHAAAPGPAVSVGSGPDTTPPVSD